MGRLAKVVPILLVPVAAILLQSSLASSTTVSLERKTGSIAIVALDGNVKTVDQSGSWLTNVTSDASVSEDESGVSYFYQFPAWSPDGRTVAFVGMRRTAQEVIGTSVWTAPADGMPPVQVFSGDDRTPRFLSWAPDSSRLVFVASQGGGGEQLDTVAAAGGTVRTLDEGSAFAWRWKNGAAALAVHSVKEATGAEVEKVSILDPRGVLGDQDLAPVPGGFEAPAWSADGKGIFMAVNENAGYTLYLEDRAGAVGRPLAHLEGDATIDLSPDGTRLAWAAQGKSGDPLSRKLFVLDLPLGSVASMSAAPRPLSGDDFVAAFFWSPDGTKIAYFAAASATDESAEDQELTLKVLDVRAGTVHTVTRFHPNAYFAGLLREFGQYAESVRLWSPDGTSILYCKQETDSFDIMVAPADQSAAPRKIADGLMATWSPH